MYYHHINLWMSKEEDVKKMESVLKENTEISWALSPKMKDGNFCFSIVTESLSKMVSFLRECGLVRLSAISSEFEGIPYKENKNVYVDPNVPINPELYDGHYQIDIIYEQIARI